jgi:hypothetical protein
MMAPFAFHGDDFAGGGADDVSDDRNQLFAAVNLDTGNGIAVLVVGVGDPLDLAAKFGKVVGSHWR